MLARIVAALDLLGRGALDLTLPGPPPNDGQMPSRVWRSRLDFLEKSLPLWRGINVEIHTIEGAIHTNTGTGRGWVRCRRGHDPA